MWRFGDIPTLNLGQDNIPKQKSKAVQTDYPPSRPWHALQIESILETLDSTKDGLSEREASRRLQRDGANELHEKSAQSEFLRFLGQFKNVLIYILLVAALVTATIGHWTDSIVICGVVLINAIIGYVQEGRAQRAIARIKDLLSEKTVVLRNGRPVRVDSRELVVGDVTVLEQGERVPADIRLMDSVSLATQEAILTGESAPVEKTCKPVSENAQLGDRSSMIYSGTLITRGRARGIVVGSGENTELGKISRLLGHISQLQTPLLRKMAGFGRTLSAIILTAATFSFLFGVFVHQSSTTEMFLAAVGIAVAAIPEGLPAILTIALAIGVESMAKKNALIRRLPAVEAIGAVTVICSDKTGTFTRNEMSVDAVVFNDARQTHARIPDEAIKNDAARSMLACAVLCNDALADSVSGQWAIEGEPMESALLVWAIENKCDPEAIRRSAPREAEIPFDADRRFMATRHIENEKRSTIYLKGAPEAVLQICTNQLEGGQRIQLKKEVWQRAIDTLTGSGRRALAFAVKDCIPGSQDLSECVSHSDFTLLGFVGLIDPPRKEAIEAVARCQRAGIRVIMITGDHSLTARAIARRIGLENTQDVVTGDALDAMPPADLAKCAKTVDIFARTSPETKLNLVSALQADNQIVAMTGDGVNDAPALKRADIGIAMGKKGAAVARDSAEMVLVDDDFSSIAHAVQEGRTVYDNIKKSILYILPTSSGEALIIMAAVFAGTTLPITPVQILWINMVTTITLALALAFERSEPEIMKRPPRKPDEPLLDRFLFWRVCLISGILVAGIFGVFLWMIHSGARIDVARTAAVNGLVLFEIFYLFNCRKLSEPATKGIFDKSSLPAWFAVAVVILLQCALTYIPFMNAAFQTAPIGAETWLLITAVAATIFLIVELEKLMQSRELFPSMRVVSDQNGKQM